MKKLLSILGGLGMIGTTSATVVSCKDKQQSEPDEKITTPLSEVLNLPKKMWLDTGLFNSFSTGEIKSAELSKLVWTGMFDARHKGDDSEGGKESLKEFEDKHLADVITLHMTADNVKLEKLKDFATEIAESGSKYIEDNKDKESKNLEASLSELNDSLDNDKISGEELLEAVNKTILAIKEFKSRLEGTSTDEFKLIVSEKDKINKDVKLTLENDLTAHFTTGEDGRISDVLVGEGSENFKDLTLILTV